MGTRNEKTAVKFWEVALNFAKNVGKLGLEAVGIVMSVKKGTDILPEISGNKAIFEPTKVFTGRRIAKGTEAPRNE